MNPKRLSPDEWDAIRKIWEYDPTEPTYAEASRRAAEKSGFNAPGKTAVQSRAKRMGWERKGSLGGIVAEAQRLADRKGRTDGVSASFAIAARDEAVNTRADVLARHREEWQGVATLIEEALKCKDTDPGAAFDRMKTAKITAEATMIQQVGERRAWGMDTPDTADVSKMTDAQLEALARGRKTT